MSPVMERVSGPNFSGRSEWIDQRAAALSQEERAKCASIGPVPASAFSGLAETFGGEIEENKRANLKLLPNLETMMHLNLHTLSGGEQSLCAIASALVYNPDVLTIDCTLEQLDHDRRAIVIRNLQESGLKRVIVCDNRDQEWSRDIDMDVYVADEKRSKEFLPISGDREFPNMDTNSVLVEAESLGFKYKGGAKILNQCNLILKPGRIVHFVGKNGVGKSTLAKLLVGAILPSEGAFRLVDDSGQELVWKTSEMVSKRSWHGGRFLFWDRPGQIFSYHCQNPDDQLFFNTVEKEIRAGANRPGRTLSYSKDLTETAIEVFGLTQIRNRHPQDLPFACRKRVALAATLACGTPWTILDEPTLGQDDASAKEIAKIIKKIAASGRGIIIISHSTSFASSMDCESLLLDGGSLFRTNDV